MKTNQFIKTTLIFLSVIALIFTACRKKKEKDTDTKDAQDNAMAETSFNDMQQIGSEASKSSGQGPAGTGGLLSQCATLSNDTVNHVITVDFGPTNCLCKDNRYRRGKLYIHYTPGKNYWDSSAVITIKTAPTDDYFVNDHKVTGVKTITNMGTNSKGNMNWDINVSGKVIKANNQGTITWSSTRNREWIAGSATPLTWTDDVYSITGSANGTSASGASFSATIDGSDPLIRKMNCHWFVQGKFDFTPGNKPTRHVDYGYCDATKSSSGCCDNWVSVTINGNTYYKQLN